jgi:hypothetical protein
MGGGLRGWVLAGFDMGCASFEGFVSLAVMDCSLEGHDAAEVVPAEENVTHGESVAQE